MKKTIKRKKAVKPEPKNYFSVLLALLIIVSIVVAYFIYSMVAGDDKMKVVKLSPSQVHSTFPTTAPSVPQPTTPPPAN